VGEGWASRRSASRPPFLPPGLGRSCVRQLRLLHRRHGGGPDCVRRLKRAENGPERALRWTRMRLGSGAGGPSGEVGTGRRGKWGQSAGKSDDPRRGRQMLPFSHRRGSRVLPHYPALSRTIPCNPPPIGAVVRGGPALMRGAAGWGHDDPQWQVLPFPAGCGGSGAAWGQQAGCGSGYSLSASWTSGEVSGLVVSPCDSAQV